MARYSRTDLAAEAQRLREGQLPPEGTPGLRVEEEQKAGLTVNAVEILDGRGEQALGMPRGRYYCLQLPELPRRAFPSFPETAAVLAELIRRCLPPGKLSSVLVCALGNPDVTPDALGPLAAESVLVTRHLRGQRAFRDFCPTSLCRPGVLGTSGMESSFQIRTLCAALRPSLVVAIDALAAADSAALCRCVQITDAGIAPGSGVGNDRAALSRENLGVPVAAIGVPTVIDAGNLSDDPALASLFVTPRDIDSAVRQLARLVGYGLNAALNPGLGFDEMDLLLG